MIPCDDYAQLYKALRIDDVVKPCDRLILLHGLQNFLTFNKKHEWDLNRKGGIPMRAFRILLVVLIIAIIGYTGVCDLQIMVGTCSPFFLVI